jgi:uncharacterized repeat protein (TIGR03803 family)
MRLECQPAFKQALVTAVAIALILTGCAAAQHESTIFNFSIADRTEGLEPEAGLIMDAAGNLYGTTAAGGDHELGTVFELMPAPQGTWTERVLHSFSGNGTDGATPLGNLTMDKAGNLYGTTVQGGTGTSCGYFWGGCGVVFELKLNEDGQWSEQILHNFDYGDGSDGYNPNAGVVLDSAGNVYGTTFFGGNGPCVYFFTYGVGCGVVFELSPSEDGTWTENVVLNLQGPDGAFPAAGLAIDAASNLYGVAVYGGTTASCYGYNEIGCGTVFSLTPGSDGTWQESVLHQFGVGTDGFMPFGTLAIDASDNLFGTTLRGGANHGSGIAFELSPENTGVWSEAILHVFQLESTDASQVYSGLTLVNGNLYGSSDWGGIENCYGFQCGTVFEIQPEAKATWSEKILYSFSMPGGINPVGGVVLDPSGNIYGMTQFGGNGNCDIDYNPGCGTVYMLTPPTEKKMPLALDSNGSRLAPLTTPRSHPYN